LQILNGHALDVATVADGGFGVIVPLVGGGMHALDEDADGAIFRRSRTRCAPPSFPNKIRSLDEAIDQAIRFQVDAEFEFPSVPGRVSK